jgi:hypothetical protein
MSHHKHRWAVLDCGKYPSEKNCKIKLMAPEDQVDEILELGVTHAVMSHGHAKTPELREMLKECIEVKEE